jgi:glycopeptide antibiotics resistance protein
MKRSFTSLWLFLAYGAFVVYGSLVPLEYRPLPLDLAWQRFQRIPFLELGLDSRADWVANGVLYAPLAFFGARAAWALGLAQALAAALAIALCWALAVGVEFTQLWFPARTVSLNDILAECLGSVVGAFAAPFLAGWLDRLAQAWRHGGARLLPRLLELYGAAYVLLCFFPYDLLLSAAEFDGKLNGAGWGWWLAPHERGMFLVLLQLGVEVALAMPIGAALVLRRPGAVTPWARVLAVGALLGLGIEGGQMLIASGVSQGASVASRVLGVAAGAVLLPWLRTAGLPGLRAALRPVALPLWALYLPLLTAVNGAFRFRWQGLAEAQASWLATHLLPFYYHYYTTEAIAMFSLGSVALMYLPVAALGWLHGWRARTVVIVAALLCSAVEAGKLFLAETHADPTNLLIAMAANALAMGLGALAYRMPPPVGAAAPAPRLTRGSAWLLALPAAAAWALAFPAWPLELLLLLTAAAAVTWRWPVAALLLVPALLPVLDLAPWSGRFYLDEFDLLQAVVLAVALHRTPAQPAPRRLLALAFSLLAFSLALSSLRALWPLAWPDANSFNSYLSPWNALRIAKGGVWAWLFVRLWQRLPAAGPLKARLFSAGMVFGLGATVLFMLWERVEFVGLFDFATNFRATGPFSAMHKGGASIECYLVVGAAFVAALVLRARSLALRAAALLGLAGVSYAVMVTFSRNGYGALAAVLAVSLLALLAGLRWRPLPWQPLVFGLLALGVALGVALPVLEGRYAQERLAKSERDLASRQAHWEDGLSLRDPGALTTLFGMGLGRFPDTHFWRSREPQHAGSYSLGRDGDRRFLRLGQGATLYIDQILDGPATGVMGLSLDARAVAGRPKLTASLCEKWTLTSLGCTSVEAAITPAPAGAAASSRPGPWQHIDIPVDAGALLKGLKPWAAPLRLSLHTPADGALDVTNVQLGTVVGDQLLRNGSFTRGMDHWFFATDLDPPWQLHSLPATVLFDQGWLGVVAWTAVALCALAAALALAWRGQALLPAALPALVGFGVSGSVNTLIDVPRFLWLLLVLLWLAAERAPPAQDRAP